MFPNFELKPTAIAIGMGMGTSTDTSEGFKALLGRIATPIVLDADALNLLAIRTDLKKLLPENSILTPHEGELKRLVGEWKDDFDKLKKAQKLSEDLRSIVVLKGAHTLIISNGETYINTTGNPGMATAGSGDTLSGLLAGLLAQGYEPLEASLLGVFLHGAAGNIGAHDLGYEALTASDIIDRIGDAFIALFESPKSGNQNGEADEFSEQD